MPAPAGSGAPRRGSLLVVGTGMTLAHQITIEALTAIREAEKLFYLTPNPAVGKWLKGLNATAETLEDSYAEGKPRAQTYREIAERIVQAVRTDVKVCAAFYGHPAVFVEPSHEAIRLARSERFSARMLPGVSAEDCLFADLAVESQLFGWQSFEATDFLGMSRRFDPSTALILWQVGLLGERSVRKRMTCQPERLQRLTEVLRRSYPPRHPVILYEAAQFPITDPIIERATIASLPRKAIAPATTIYIPPRPSRPMNRTVVRWLRE